MSVPTSLPLVFEIRATSRRLKTVLFGLFFAVVVGLGGIQVAEGQTLKADYRFQNTRNSTVGSSSLVDTGANTFQSEIVDGITRTVLRFPLNNGLRLSPTSAIIPTNSYTIVMLFKVDSVSGFVRLVDFKNRTSDNGLYIDKGHLESCTTCTAFLANTYVQVAYTRNSTGTFAGYVNGALQGQGPDAGNDFVIDGSNVLNFFQDDLVAGNEASAGSVARIRLYDAPMTGAQIAALDREPAEATTFSVTNTNDSGLGSLRQAMLDANANAGADTISFNIAGAGVHMISPTSALPTVNGPVIIDGTTQFGFAGSPIIELNGVNAGSSVAGLFVTAGNSTIRGLVINRFSLAGIQIQTGGGNVLEGNFIGPDSTGAGTFPGSNFDGVVVSQSNNNRIGGTTAGAPNLISGNGRVGLYILNGSTGNLVQGNLIGTNAAGTAAVANGNHGVIVQGAANNTIGGTPAAARNVISGNTLSGIAIDASGAGYF